MDPQLLDEVTNEIQSLHKAMKNLFEIAFAASPILALSTHGWDSKSYNSIFLFRVCLLFEFICLHLTTTNQIFIALGNDRPEILVKIEDSILETIIALSEGKSREIAMRDLYKRLTPLEKELSADDDAMRWFDMSTAVNSNPQPSEIPATPPPGLSVYFNLYTFLMTQLDFSDALMDEFKGQWCLLRGYFYY
jgi:hypothetical protein